MKKTLFSLGLGALSFFYSADSSEAITCSELRSNLENGENLITSIDDDGDLKIPYDDLVVFVIAKDASANHIHFSNSSREIDSIRVQVYSKKSIDNSAKRDRIINNFNNRSIFKMGETNTGNLVITFYLSELCEATDSYVKKAVLYGIRSLTNDMDSIIQQEF